MNSLLCSISDEICLFEQVLPGQNFYHRKLSTNSFNIHFGLFTYFMHMDSPLDFVSPKKKIRNCVLMVFMLKTIFLF